MFRVIGLSGQAGVGKDFVARWMQQKLPNAMIVGFADQLKLNTMMSHSLSFDSVFGNKTREIRQLLQQTGTEQGRDVHGKDIWIRYLRGWMQLHHTRSGIENFIVTDCRFPNEVEFIKSYPNHLVIRIIAPIRNIERLEQEGSAGTTNILHSSEAELSYTLFDHCIYNDPQDDLYLQLHKLMVDIPLKME